MKIIWRLVTFVLCILVAVEASEFPVKIPVAICDPRKWSRVQKWIEEFCKYIADMEPRIKNGNFIFKADDGITRPTDVVHSFMRFGRRR